MMNYPSIRLEDLLGRPLNNVESKYAPKKIFYTGPMEIPVSDPKVSIIGSRNASEKGLAEAEEIAEILVENKVVIVSGLANGIDTVGHKTAMECRGKTIAVIGTPLDRIYPKENIKLQNEIMKNHLVISQYPIGTPIRPENFVFRNKTMSLISDATVIVEAGESSGSLYQGWETLRIGRPLFIGRTIVENKQLQWPKKMIQRGAMELDNPKDILGVLPTDIQTDD